MRCFMRDAPRLRYAFPSTKLLVLGIVLLIASFLAVILQKELFIPLLTIPYITTIINICIIALGWCFVICGVVSITLITIALLIHITLPIHTRIQYMVRKGLFAYEYGNPLHLKEGELLPKIKCKEIENGKYELSISAVTVTVEDIQNVSSNISSCLNKRLERYAVTSTDTDVAFNKVSFVIEDVTTHKELIVHSAKELKQNKPTKLIIQEQTYIDLTTSGSILVSGKTRSGKSTATISLLMQALLWGRDNYGSEIVIIDPKQAELSRLPHTVTLDENGEATEILNALKRFAETIVKRQKVLNDLSEKKGDAVKWWDVGMHVSFLFIDEYVAARTIFPQKATKENPDYCLATFDGLVKRIVTMGASAGCYIIISIAEASVSEGGLPAMLRSAMTTKILFKPTMAEARLIWDSEKLKDFGERVYNAGDAWFSSTDGIHDNVSYVHFPIMEFPVYRELGELLQAYYQDVDLHRPPSEA